jgi:hypothetical protein
MQTRKTFSLSEMVFSCEEARAIVTCRAQCFGAASPPSLNPSFFAIDHPSRVAFRLQQDGYGCLSPTTEESREAADSAIDLQPHWPELNLQSPTVARWNRRMKSVSLKIIQVVHAAREFHRTHSAAAIPHRSFLTCKGVIP